MVPSSTYPIDAVHSVGATYGFGLRTSRPVMWPTTAQQHERPPPPNNGLWLDILCPVGRSFNDFVVLFDFFFCYFAFFSHSIQFEISSKVFGRFDDESLEFIFWCGGREKERSLWSVKRTGVCYHDMHFIFFFCIILLFSSCFYRYSWKSVKNSV